MLTRGTLLASLVDIAANRELWPNFVKHKNDFIAYGFPPIEEGMLAPCMANINDRPCQGSGILAMPLHSLGTNYVDVCTRNYYCCQGQLKGF